jgi:phage/plasmid-associated DNA primase
LHQRVVVNDLFGLRLAVLTESDSGRRLAEGTVKRLTSSERAVWYT